MRYLKILITLVAVMLLAQLVAGQSAIKDEVRPYAQTAQLGDVILVFVHLNNITVDELFDAPQKYSMRARANQETLFYVQGSSSAETDLSNDFLLKQGDETVEGTSHNIRNFTGGTVRAGQPIDGVLQFDADLDLNQPFAIQHDNGTVQFTFTEMAVEKLQPAPADIR